MIVILVPFFLAAQVHEAAWQGAGGRLVPEASYRFVLNSTAVTAVGAGRAPERSTRFDMSALLRCRFRGPASLVCRMSDAQAVSFSSSSLDPAQPAQPLPGSEQQHPEYQLAEEAFEVTFGPQGVGKILVNRSVSPHDLNMIRAVVSQLNVGANVGQQSGLEAFRLSDKSVIGKCEASYRLLRLPAAEENSQQADYRLSGLESLGRRKGETLRLEKQRDLQRCSLRADYFFGSREGLRSNPAESDFEARIVSSDSTIHVSDEHFASYTRNELQIDRQYAEDLSIHESYAMSLMSIDMVDVGLMPASIVDPASASLYAYQYIDDDDESAELHKRARASRPTSRSPPP